MALPRLFQPVRDVTASDMGGAAQQRIKGLGQLCTQALADGSATGFLSFLKGPGEDRAPIDRTPF